MKRPKPKAPPTPPAPAPGRGSGHRGRGGRRWSTGARADLAALLATALVAGCSPAQRRGASHGGPSCEPFKIVCTGSRLGAAKFAVTSIGVQPRGSEPAAGGSAAALGAVCTAIAGVD